MRDQAASRRMGSGWRWLLLLGAALAAAAATLGPLGGATDPALAALAGRAATGDLDAARALREAGPAGLSALVDADVSRTGRSSAEYRAALDLVCAQVECSASHLFWYTDFDAARRAAEASGEPIVALRLLGRLDEELSCANSRYFRLLLYSDPEIARWLREKAVLYWSSERPVPKVTVDYGDGRRLVGTVTGNSVHYLLDPSGRLVDALPGLATPDRFLAWLRSSSELAHEWARLDDVAFAARLRDDHRRADQNLLRAVHEDLRAQGWNDGAIEDATELFEPAVDEASDAVPTAAEASRLALTKAAGEAPLLTSIGTPPLRPQQSVAVVSLAANEHWKAQLSREARGLVAARAPETVRTDLAGALERMGQRLAEDGVRNEVFLHRRIHAALAKAQTAPRWQDFNAWVYATLFLTPASDPWLGLAPTEALWGLRVDTGATSAGAAAGATGGR